MRPEDDIKRERIIIQDDMLFREIPVEGSDNYELKCVITKDEFLACYNKWIKEANNES